MRPLQELRGLFDNLPLRWTIALGLLLGLTLTVALSSWRDLQQRQETAVESLEAEHERLLDLLAIEMRVPIWEIRPETGRPLVDLLMSDRRVVEVTVTAPVMDNFLQSSDESRREGRLFGGERPVIYEGEEIGSVFLTMTAAPLAAEIARHWRGIVVIAIVQLVLGMVIIFALLRMKVLRPIDGLIAHSRAIAEHRLDTPVPFQRSDELGELARTLETTRNSLSHLISDLEQRNAELEASRAELAQKSGVLRAILDNMGDAITLIDSEHRLVAWNERLSSLLDYDPDIIERGRPIEDLVRTHLTRRGVEPAEIERNIEEMRLSFQQGGSMTARYRATNGRDILIRRRPTPGGGFVSSYSDVTEQAEAQRQADEALQWLRTVMDAVPAMLSVKSSERRYEMANQRLLDFYGLTRDQLLGRRSEELADDGIASDVLARDHQVLDSKRQLPFQEIERKGADERCHVIWSTKLPMLDEAGEVAHILTVDVDLTDLREAEKDRQRWLQLFEDALESIPHGFAVFDAEHRLVACNAAYEALTGASEDGGARVAGAPAETLERRFLELLPTDRSEEDVAAVAEVFGMGGEAAVRQRELCLADGRWLMLGRYETAEGGFVAMLSDTTERRRMERAVRKSEKLIRKIVEACPVPIGMTRASDGTIIYESPASMQLFQREPGTSRSRRTADYYVDPEDRERYLARLREQGFVDDFETRFRRSDGTEFWASLSARLIEYQEEAVVVSSTLDLSERHAMEETMARQREALYQSEKLNALGGLLAGVAHELNNPLSVVVGQSLMLQEMAAEERIRERAQKIGKAADRCARIVRTFLAMARQSAPKRAEIDLRTMIEAALEIAGYGLRGGDIKVTLDLAPDMPRVWGDADQLSQVMMNLIVNAQQALCDQAPPRLLTIRSGVSPSTGYVELQVEDNGPGIREDIRPRIFEPFFTTKEEGVGTGVGLAVCRGIVRAHDGTIDVDSTPGEGTRFTVTLPPCTEDSSSDAEPQEPGPTASKLRVLVVDDEPQLVQTLAEILGAEGHQVHTASSGRAAQRALRAHEIDLILCDIRMPDLDGPGFYRELQRSDPELAKRIVFITGDALSANVRQFLDETDLPYLEKPIMPADLRELVVQQFAEVS